MSNEYLIKWLANGERGLSSNTIATKLSGIDCMGFDGQGHYGSAPSDPSDFGRCMKLLDAVPEFRARLSEMKDVSERWNALVDHWDEFEELYYEECETGSCPKLFYRMR